MVVAVYVALQNSRIQTLLTRELLKNLSEKVDSRISVGNVYFRFFNQVVLENVLLEDQQQDTLFYAQKITAHIDSIDRKRKSLALNSLSFQHSMLRVNQDSSDQFNFKFLIDSLRNPGKQPHPWKISVNHFDFRDSEIGYQNFSEKTEKKYFITDLNFDISDFSWNRDSVDFIIEELSLNENNNLRINNLSAAFHSVGDTVKINQLNVETQYSAISNSSLLFDLPEKNSEEELQVDFDFSHSVISFTDLAQLIPSLRGMDQVVDLSGNIYGTVDDLKGKNLVMRTGRNTLAQFDFYVNEISDPQSMYLFLDLKNLKTTFNDISDIKLPVSSDEKHLTFPQSFYEAGILNYRGNFTGFLTDFVAYGTLTSDMGTLTTDVSLVPGAGGRISYNGKVATENFKFGELFRNEIFGELTFNGSVDGHVNSTSNTFYGKYKGKIARFEVNDYNYENIQIDGRIDNRRFDGVFSINDPNLKFDFIGQVNLNPEIPVFDFKLNILEAHPWKLNLSKNFPAAEISLSVLANFQGSNIDNLDGMIEVQSGRYSNRNGVLNLKGMELKTAPDATSNLLSFSSDFFDLKIDGSYHLTSLLNAFRKSVNRYLPAVDYEKIAQAEKNKFEYFFEGKNLDSLIAVFAPGYRVETPFLLYGKLDSEKALFELEGSIPAFSTKGFMAKDIFIGNGPVHGLYKSKFRMGEVMLRNGMKLYNMTVESELSDNVMENQISWTNYHKLTYSGRIITKATFSETDSSLYPHIEIEGYPTKIYVADSLWQIAPFTASVDSNAVKINNFRLYNGKQIIKIDGEINEKPSSKLTAVFEHINLWHLNEYMNRDFAVGGTLNGTAGLADFYNERFFFSDLLIEDFVYKDQIIGKISLTNEWDYFENNVDSEIRIEKNERQSLLAHGSYNPTTKDMLYTAKADRLSLVILETLIRKNFSGIHGDASGKLTIYGQPDHIQMDGVLLGENAGLTIDYTKVRYNFTDSVYFNGDTIKFDKINIEDENGNTGIFDGSIVHRNFQNMQYDLLLQSPKILAYNTTHQDNSQFFGKIVARGRLDITGRGNSVHLSGSGTTLNGTAVNISLQDDAEIQQYDFIQFVSQEETEEKEFRFAPRNDGDFNLNLTIHATPDAKVQLIYNSQIGDVIKAQGEGYLNFELDKEGNIYLSGDYTVNKGDYLFTLQNVINKRFDIERGGSIIWSGDPYNAIIDINAVYRLKASVYDMLVHSYNEVSANQRIPVETKILLSENLSNPEINFEINFPTVDSYLTSQLRQYFNTPEEMNRQILSLLVLGKFYVPEYMRGTYATQNSNLIGATASELFSNQLSNWLSQINNNVDIGFNYRPGNQITDDEIELALSTQIFNNRVTINGNIGNNVNPYTGNNSQLVGDFEVNVKLIPNGKVQLKAYNQSNNNLIYETSPYTQGVGFSFTEEYNTLGDLWRKMTSLFKKEEGE